MNRVFEIASKIVKWYESNNTKVPSAREILKLEQFENEKLELDSIKQQVKEFVSQYPIPIGLLRY